MANRFQNPGSFLSRSVGLSNLSSANIVAGFEQAGVSAKRGYDLSAAPRPSGPSARIA